MILKEFPQKSYKYYSKLWNQTNKVFYQFGEQEKLNVRNLLEYSGEVVVIISIKYYHVKEKVWDHGCYSIEAASLFEFTNESAFILYIATAVHEYI